MGLGRRTSSRSELPRRGAIIRVIGYAAVIRVSASALDGSCHAAVHSILFGKFRLLQLFRHPELGAAGPGVLLQLRRAGDNGLSVDQLDLRLLPAHADRESPAGRCSPWRRPPGRFSRSGPPGSGRRSPPAARRGSAGAPPPAPSASTERQLVVDGDADGLKAALGRVLLLPQGRGPAWPPLMTSTSSRVVSMGRLSPGPDDGSRRWRGRTAPPRTAQRMRRSSSWGHSLTTVRAVRASVWSMRISRGASAM